MSTRTITLDVREDIRSGRPPLGKIMDAAADLIAGGNLLVIAPFQPEPLLAAMRKQGFNHTSRLLPSGDWEVTFTRSAAATGSPRTAGCSTPRGFQTPAVIQVDARGLEPPQPLVKILEALSQLPPGAALEARTDRRPLHLYPALEERGYMAETKEQTDGSFLTHIRQR